MDDIYKVNTETENRLIIDSYINPIDDLETVQLLLDRPNNLKWKSIIIMFHHALYMFCIAILRGSSPNEVTSQSIDESRNIYFKKGDDKWKKSRIVRYNNSDLYQLAWDYIDGDPSFKKVTKRKREALIGFWTAIARVQDGEFYMARYTFSKPLVLTAEEKDSIVELVYYRNEFTHFIPTSLLMHTDNLKNVCKITLNIIERLSKNLHFTFIADENLLKVCQNIIIDLKTKL